jgi:hypothetical protein
VPDSIKDLLHRTADRMAASAERCISSRRHGSLTVELIAVSRDMIERSRARYVGSADPQQIMPVLEKSSWPRTNANRAVRIAAHPDTAAGDDICGFEKRN